MFDVDDVIDNELDPEIMAHLIGICSIGLTGNGSDEAKWLLDFLEEMQKDCEHAIS